MNYRYPDVAGHGAIPKSIPTDSGNRRLVILSRVPETDEVNLWVS